MRTGSLAALLLLLPAVAPAADRLAAARAVLGACYDPGTTPEGKYGCFGTATQACRSADGATEADLVPCVEAETAAWEEIRQAEFARTASAIRDTEAAGKPCAPSVAACLDQLAAYDARSRTEAAERCDHEASPQASAATPPWPAPPARCARRPAARCGCGSCGRASNRRRAAACPLPPPGPYAGERGASRTAGPE